MIYGKGQYSHRMGRYNCYLSLITSGRGHGIYIAQLSGTSSRIQGLAFVLFLRFLQIGSATRFRSVPLPAQRSIPKI
jgi:hypothetical protein